MSTRTTEDIILSAYYRIGEIRPNEVPSDGQINQGFYLLNNMIGALSMDNLFIPLDSSVSFFTVPGFDKYKFTTELAPIGPPVLPPAPIFIPSNRIVKLNFVTLTFTGSTGSIIYPVTILSKAEFYGMIRVTNLVGPCTYCFLDIQANDSTIQFYPTPNLSYPVTVQSKVGLDYVTRFTDVTTLPPFYFEFLETALARKLLAYYPSANWPETAEKEYQVMRKLIQGANSWDCTVRIDETLNMNRRYFPIISNGLIFT